jgi:hypothetical protein
MEYADERLQSLLQSKGVSFRELSREDTWSYQQLWREVFCAAMKDQTGKWTTGLRDWNTFLEGYARCLINGKALHAFLSCQAHLFLVVPEIGNALCCSANAMPDLSGEQGLFVFPPDLEWTMVFSYEGNFFSRRDWQTRHTGLRR